MSLRSYLFLIFLISVATTAASQASTWHSFPNEASSSYPMLPDQDVTTTTTTASQDRQTFEAFRLAETVQTGKHQDADNCLTISVRLEDCADNVGLKLRTENGTIVRHSRQLRTNHDGFVVTIVSLDDVINDVSDCSSVQTLDLDIEIFGSDEKIRFRAGFFQVNFTNSVGETTEVARGSSGQRSVVRFSIGTLCGQTAKIANRKKNAEKTQSTASTPIAAQPSSPTLFGTLLRINMHFPQQRLYWEIGRLGSKPSSTMEVIDSGYYSENDHGSFHTVVQLESDTSYQFLISDKRDGATYYRGSSVLQSEEEDRYYELISLDTRHGKEISILAQRGSLRNGMITFVSGDEITLDVMETPNVVSPNELFWPTHRRLSSSDYSWLQLLIGPAIWLCFMGCFCFFFIKGLRLAPSTGDRTLRPAFHMVDLTLIQQQLQLSQLRALAAAAPPLVGGMEPEERRRFVKENLLTKTFSTPQHSAETSVKEEEEEEGEINAAQCAICLGEYNDGDEICYSNNSECGHEFHPDCIVLWLQRREECPCCRQPYLEKAKDITPSS